MTDPRATHSDEAHVLAPDDIERLTTGAPMMVTIGASVEATAPGRVVFAMPFSERIRQQHGFVHAGALTTLMDHACGAAAYTLAPKGTGILTAEFKVNLLSPAKGERIVAEAKVVKPGRTLTVVTAEAFSETAGERKLVAIMTATIAMVAPGAKPG